MEVRLIIECGLLPLACTCSVYPNGSLMTKHSQFRL
ncbi:DUF1652 domain-containing protein [Pseudomonas sp. R1-7]